MGTQIYYFSGTGNSLKVAKDLKAELQDAELIQICRATMEMTEEAASESIGIVFPVYRLGLPFIVKEFIDKLKINKNSYVFAVATYGGVIGASFRQIREILIKKGVELSAAFAVSMPGNCQILYPPFPKKIQLKRFKLQEKKAAEIAESVRNKKKVKSKNAAMSSFGTFAYKSFKPHEGDKYFWTDNNCNGCRICEKVCPAKNIEFVDGKPQWKHHCEQCLACMQWCPRKSVQYKNVTIKRERYQHPDVNVTELFSH